jgi:hypothetical protein
MRGKRLARIFPQYSAKLLKEFSLSDEIVHDS